MSREPDRIVAWLILAVMFIVGIIMIIVGGEEERTCEEWGTVPVTIDHQTRCVPWGDVPDIEGFPEP